MIINKKHILVISEKTRNLCLQALKQESVWRITRTNISKASEILEEKYIDLVCIKTNSTHEQILKFLKSVKNKGLKTKSLAIIPDRSNLKNIYLRYGCDDYLCNPYNCEDLILRCKKLIKCIPVEYNIIYKNRFLSYERRLNRVMYQNTYIPLTPTEILIIKLLIKNSFISKCEIQKYLNSKLGKNFSNQYITLLIHRAKKKIKLCTGRNLIRNKYGCGYYVV